MRVGKRVCVAELDAKRVSLDTLSGVPLISFFSVTMPAAFPLTTQLIHVLIHCDLLITAVGS